MPHNKDKTHCPQGHQYTKANTAVYTRVRNGHTTTFRVCKTCNTQRNRAWHRAITHAE